MGRSARFVIAVVLVAGVYGQGAAAEASGQRAASETWYGSWQRVAAPTAPGGDNSLQDVAATSPTDAWAVGSIRSQGTEAPYDRTLIQHWDGTSWKIVPSPNPSPFSNGLMGVVALSPTNAWAVGTTVLHWNGVKWSVVPTPNGRGAFAIAAVSANDIWAVGHPSPDGEMAMHWDGVRWSAVPTPILPNPVEEGTALLDVAAVSRTDVRAVGQVNDGGLAGLVERWNGTVWKRTSAPNGLPRGVAASSATNVWVVGIREVSGDYRPWAARWNGYGWTNYVLTAPYGGALQDAVISGPSTWAVGYQSNANYVPRTLIARWTAASGWARVPSPNVGSGLPNTGLVNTLSAVTRVPGTGESLWAVGDYGTPDQTDEDSRPLILRCC